MIERAPKEEKHMLNNLNQFQYLEIDELKTNNSDLFVVILF